MATGITGYGVYLPKYRIKREDIAKAWGMSGRGENSVCGPDEDVISMGVEAAENAVLCAGIDAKNLGGIYLGTDSLPHIEHSSLGIFIQSLGTKQDVDLADFTASPRASIAAFKAMKDAIDSGRVGNGLVVATESRDVPAGSSMEASCGDGAGALVLGTEGIVAEIENIYSYNTHFVDRWREAGAPYVKEYDPRFSREFGYQKHMITSGKIALKESGNDIGDFKYVVLQPAGDPRTAEGVARALGVTPEQTKLSDVFSLVGELGAASVNVQIAKVLDKAEPSDRILAISYGSGSSDVLTLKVTEEIKEKRKRVRSFDHYLESKVYIEYLKFVGLKGTFKKEEDIRPMGVPPMSPMVWRDSPDVVGMKGAKCKKCGYINFPPSIRKICIRCGNTEFEPVKLGKKGKVYAFVVNVYLPPPLQGPLPMIIGEMEDGTWFRALGTELKLKEVEIDLPVELVLRRIIRENGVGVYSPTFRPVR